MTVVRSNATSVELEIAGERVVVENWPEHFPDPPGPVDVNGERWSVTVARIAGGSEPARTASAPRPAPPAPSPEREVPANGHPILPPMPGKVIEVRVKEGDPVRKGDVLLVLEAMKMRNELTSPIDGVVRGLAVAPGTNVRAKQSMLFVAPG